VADGKMSRERNASAVAEILSCGPIRDPNAEFERARWTGRPGYPVRAMVGMTTVKSLYALPTWTRIVALVRDHAGLREVLGCTPSIGAC